MRLENKVAIVTGGGSGLGKKIGDFGFSVKKKKKKPQYDRRK